MPGSWVGGSRRPGVPIRVADLKGVADLVLASYWQLVLPTRDYRVARFRPSGLGGRAGRRSRTEDKRGSEREDRGAPSRGSRF
jgi:hypothetical protein